ncbi:hypothetical protein PCA_06365 [Rhodanobacter sp. PCA2]|nr:hypothetical protein [Rhodanobacter sp. PCA2]
MPAGTPAASGQWLGAGGGMLSLSSWLARIAVVLPSGGTGRGWRWDACAGRARQVQASRAPMAKERGC